MWSLISDLGERRPHVAGVAEAVKQHDGRAAAADADILGSVADRHLLGTEGCGPGFDIGVRRRRGDKARDREECSDTTDPDRGGRLR